MASSFASRPEVCTLARRVAGRMGFRRALLLGCANETLVGGLAAHFDITVVDSGKPLARTRLLWPQGEFVDWSISGSAGLPVAAERRDSSIVLLDGSLLEHVRSGDPLVDLLRAAPAVLCVDPESMRSSSGDRVHLLRNWERRCAELDLAVAWRGFVRPRHDAFVRSSAVLAIGDPADGRLGHLLQTGHAGLRLDPLEYADATPAKPARVCIASYEFVGPTKNGGIGTANTSLARALAAAGHSVECVFTGWHAGPGPTSNRRWRNRYREWDIDLEFLPAERHPLAACPHFNARRSHQLYRWLRDRHEYEPYDVIHFPECQGHAYYALLAKHQGLCFGDTTLVVGAHSPTRWIREASREPFELFEDVTDDFLERRSVELADVVISPSAYLVDWMVKRGWELPERTYVQQYVQPPDAGGATPGRCPTEEIVEIVFFGRLEVRKGIVLFCDAIDLLSEHDLSADLRITFLGKLATIEGRKSDAYLAERANSWPWAHQILSDKDRDEAVRYLRDRPCLPVMPSLVDNSPNTVAEALALSLPFVASSTGGTAELIDIDDQPSVVYDPYGAGNRFIPPGPDETLVLPSPHSLTAALAGALASPPAPVRPAADPGRNARAHVDWHSALASSRITPPIAVDERRPGRRPVRPSITVCLVADESAGSNRRALAAYAAQTVRDVDLVAITDATGRTLDRGLAEHGWRQVARRGRTLAGTLNDAGLRAAGEWVLFTTAAHLPLAHQLEALAGLTARTEADVVALTVGCGGRRGATRRPFDGVLPIGGPALLGLFFSGFGDFPFLVRRETFEALGGFPADAGVSEAHSLLAGAAIAGKRIDVCPDVLACVDDRLADDPRRAFNIGSMRRSGDPSTWLANLRPYHSICDGPLGDLPSLAHGVWAGTNGWRGALEEKCEALERHRAVLEQRIAELEERHGRQTALLSAAERQMQALRDSVEFVRSYAQSNGHGNSADRRLMRLWRRAEKARNP